MQLLDFLFQYEAKESKEDKLKQCPSVLQCL